MIIQRIQQFPNAKWDEFVRSQPNSTIYQLSGWNQIAKNAYNTPSLLIWVEDPATGEILAGTPLFFPKRVGGSYATTGVFGAYGQTLYRDADALTLLAEAVKQETDSRKASYLLWKGMANPTSAEDRAALVERSFSCRELWITALLDLQNTEDDQFKVLGSSMRAKIRKAQKSGLEICWDKTPETMSSFYSVLSANMRRKGAPIYGKAFFDQILATFFSETSLLTLWLEGRPVSGALVQVYNGTITVPFVSSLPEVFHLRPNNLLYWEIIRFGIEGGCKSLDFGTSLQDASTIEFKRSWGSEVVPLPSYFYSPKAKEVEFDPHAKGVRLGSKVLSKLPPFMFEAIGPWICSQMI